jgi:hypothetical protein
MTPMELEINGVSSEPKELANIQSSELRHVKYQGNRQDKFKRYYSDR